MDRNPVFAPKRVKNQPKGPHCPKCLCNDFIGQVQHGIVHNKCLNKKCNNIWQGGSLPEYVDPRIPTPPQNPFDAPTLDFDTNSKGEVVERIRPPSLVQSFRRGAPVPSGDE